MKIKQVKLCWNVLSYDINKRKMVSYNILNNQLKEDIARMIRKKEITNRQQLRDTLEKEFKYRYNHRAEYEFMIGGLFSELESFEKKDVYNQIEINLDRIVEYIIKEMEISF